MRDETRQRVVTRSATELPQYIAKERKEKRLPQMREPLCEVNLEVEAKQIFVISIVALNSNMELGYMSRQFKLLTVAEGIIPGGISLGNSTVCAIS